MYCCSGRFQECFNHATKRNVLLCLRFSAMLQPCNKSRIMLPPREEISWSFHEKVSRQVLPSHLSVKREITKHQRCYFHVSPQSLHHRPHHPRRPSSFPSLFRHQLCGQPFVFYESVARTGGPVTILVWGFTGTNLSAQYLILCYPSVHVTDGMTK